MPEVSDAAKRTIHGKFAVKIRVTADEGGKVSEAVFESHGPSRYFANQALQAAREWTFKPPQVDGHPATSRWTLRFEFRRSGIDAIPVEVSR
jgi:TonB family protein